MLPASVLAAAVILVLTALWIAPAVPASALTPVQSGATVASVNNTCQCVPQSIYITSASPGDKFSVSAGDILNVTYEWELPNYQPKFNGTLIHIPVMNENFTVLKDPNVVMALPQRNETITGPGWSNASLATDSKVLTTHFFFSNKLAYISTQRIAIMANVTYGTFQLEFRWQWSVYKPALHNLTVSNWSNATEGKLHQDLVWPAPLVFLSSTTAHNGVLGGVYTARMTGLVANQGEWLLEMEHPNGSVTTQQFDWGPNGTTTYFNATIPLQTYLAPLTAGAYLIHVHTPRGGIVFSITVHLTAPTTASLSVVVSPSSCGWVSINGTKYTNGAVAIVPVGPIQLASAFCTGQPFHVWSERGGGVEFATPFRSATNGTAYYNGTLIATYT